MNEQALSKAWGIVSSRGFRHRLTHAQKLFLIALAGMVPNGKTSVRVSNEILGEMICANPLGYLPRIKARLVDLGLIRLTQRGRETSVYELPFLEK